MLFFFLFIVGGAAIMQFLFKTALWWSVWLRQTMEKET